MLSDLYIWLQVLWAIYTKTARVSWKIQVGASFPSMCTNLNFVIYGKLPSLGKSSIIVSIINYCIITILLDLPCASFASLKTPHMPSFCQWFNFGNFLFLELSPYLLPIFNCDFHNSFQSFQADLYHYGKSLNHPWRGLGGCPCLKIAETLNCMIGLVLDFFLASLVSLFVDWFWQNPKHERCSKLSLLQGPAGSMHTPSQLEAQNPKSALCGQAWPKSEKPSFPKLKTFDPRLVTPYLQAG